MSSTQEYYNDQYSLHESGKRACRHSIHDLEKAKKRLSQVLRYFKVSLPPASKALDVGCGLGYYTEALRQCGFCATGIDMSKIAIESCRRKFTGSLFTCAIYPDDISETFDLIWAVDVSLLNTFDISTIKAFISSTLEKLNSNGVLIIGWHTDFSGEQKDNFSNWDFNTFEKFKSLGLNGPIIAEAKYPFFNFLLIHICRLFRKSAPIFLALKHEHMISNDR